MEPGKLVVDLKYGFRSDRWAPRYMMKDYVEVTRARACWRCGWLELSIDPAALEKHIL